MVDGVLVQVTVMLTRDPGVNGKAAEDQTGDYMSQASQRTDNSLGRKSVTCKILFSLVFCKKNRVEVSHCYTPPQVCAYSP